MNVLGFKTEMQLHTHIVKTLRRVLRKDVLMHHSPNGGKRDIITATHLKRMGTLPGWPDLQFHRDGETYFIELKQPGEYPSPVQKAVHQWLIDGKFPVAVCKDPDAVLKQVREWGLA